MNETNKIQYQDLSKPLKTLIILGWIIIAYNLLWFIIGFIEGLTSY